MAKLCTHMGKKYNCNILKQKYKYTIQMKNKLKWEDDKQMVQKCLHVVLF